MNKFEVLMDSGIAYVRGDGIKIDDGFVCIYEEVEVERTIFNPFPHPQITGTQTEKVIKEKMVHIFNADSVTAIRQVNDTPISVDDVEPKEVTECKYTKPEEGIETLLVTMVVEEGVDVAQVSKQVMKQLISQIENL